MKFLKFLQKKCKGSSSLSLLILIIFILFCVLLIEICQNIKLQFKIIDKKLILQIHRHGEIVLLKNRIQMIILKKLVESIDENGELLPEEQLFKLVVDLIPDNLKSNIAIKIQYINIDNNLFNNLPMDNKELKKMLLYDNINDSQIAIWITFHNQEYYYIIPLKNLIHLSNNFTNYNQ